MSKLRFKISMSLDGFVAGPSQRVANPLGIGGGRLHEWAFELAVFRALVGLEGGEVDDFSEVCRTTGCTRDLRFSRTGAVGTQRPFRHPHKQGLRRR